MKHELKLHTNYFEAVASGQKCFEVRRDDRGFQKGDILILRRWGTDSLFGRVGYLRGASQKPKEAADTIVRRITYILTGGQFGIEPGHVVMGIEPEEPTP